MYKFNVEKAVDGAVKWIQDFFEENGPGCNAVLGISGGKDSSVTAAPTAKSLTYNGSAQALVNAGSANGGTMQYRLYNGSWTWFFSLEWPFYRTRYNS